MLMRQVRYIVLISPILCGRNTQDWMTGTTPAAFTIPAV
jgi:hypothetical protein